MHANYAHGHPVGEECHCFEVQAELTTTDTGQTINWRPVKVVQEPTTLSFKTKDGQNVSFKAVRAVERPAMENYFDLRDEKQQLLRMAYGHDRPLKDVLNRARILTPKERNVLKMRAVQGMNLLEIGKKLGVTRERVRQIEAKAEEKLRIAPRLSHN